MNSQAQSQGKQPFDSGPLSDAGERRAIFNVLDSFRIFSQYRRQTHFNCTHTRRQKFYALPQTHQKWLNEPPISLLDTLCAVDDAIDVNADIADAILEVAIETFGLDDQPCNATLMNWHDKARPLDLNKAHSTIKQFWRDWSKEGFEAEVKPLLELIVCDLAKHGGSVPDSTKVLLPGAGLGRLLFELCLAGYIVEGNEISYHQLLSSNFILNTTERANQYKLYPFVGSFNNHSSRQNQLHMVTIPDVHPSTAIAQRLEAQQRVGEMNMSAGDFITSYSSAESAGSFDAVATVYFIDTAPNVIRYIETILHCLANDGLWINIGPLLWHVEDQMANKDSGDEHDDIDDGDTLNEPRERTGIAEPGSVELTNEEVLLLAQSMGFKLISHSMLNNAIGGYVQDPTSMLQSRYSCSHWVLKKESSAVE